MAQFLFSAFRVNSLGFWLWYCAGISIGNRPRKYLPMASVLPYHGALQVASLASSLNLYLYPNMYTLVLKNQKSMYLMNWSGILAAKCQTDSIGWETTMCSAVITSACRYSQVPMSWTAPGTSCLVLQKVPSDWLKAATTALTFKTLLRHYAKRALTPRSLKVKLESSAIIIRDRWL